MILLQRAAFHCIMAWRFCLTIDAPTRASNNFDTPTRVSDTAVRQT